MLIDLLRERRSVREFADRTVAPEIIESVLEAGRLAPSGGNEQAWKFGLITNQTMKSDIANIAYNQQWIAGAAFLIVLCTVVVPSERGGRDIHAGRFPAYAKAIREMDAGLYGRLLMEEHQTKIPGTQMMLAALEYGVGSTWVSHFDVDRLGALLNLPAGCMASEIIAFGYPASPGRARPKKSRQEIVFTGKYRG